MPLTPSKRLADITYTCGLHLPIAIGSLLSKSHNETCPMPYQVLFVLKYATEDLNRYGLCSAFLTVLIFLIWELKMANIHNFPKKRNFKKMEKWRFWLWNLRIWLKNITTRVPAGINDRKKHTQHNKKRSNYEKIVNINEKSYWIFGFVF